MAGCLTLSRVTAQRNAGKEVQLVGRCRKCGYSGELRVKKRGQLPHYRRTTMKLFLFFIIPGIIYDLAICNWKDYYCPDCRSRVC